MYKDQNSFIHGEWTRCLSAVTETEMHTVTATILRYQIEQGVGTVMTPRATKW